MINKMDEKHILFSLGDKKVRQIGEIIGNKTCNRILDFFVGENGTVSDISRKLNIPLNTVDYNVKKLVGAGLIEKSAHWWSVKGKKIPVYKISNRKIIISPKKTVANVFVWVIGLTGIASLGIRYLGLGIRKGESIQLMGSLDSVAPMREVGRLSFWNSLVGVSPWFWFLFGAWFAVVLFFVITIYVERRSR